MLQGFRTLYVRRVNTNLEKEKKDRETVLTRWSCIVVMANIRAEAAFILESGTIFTDNRSGHEMWGHMNLWC